MFSFKHVVSQKKLKLYRSEICLPSYEVGKQRFSLLRENMQTPKTIQTYDLEKRSY